jgi:hypothetical protein
MNDLLKYDLFSEYDLYDLYELVHQHYFNKILKKRLKKLDKNVSNSDANGKTPEEEPKKVDLKESDKNVSKSDANSKILEEKPNKKQNDYLDDKSVLEWEKCQTGKRWSKRTSEKRWPKFFRN